MAKSLIRILSVVMEKRHFAGLSFRFGTQYGGERHAASGSLMWVLNRSMLYGRALDIVHRRWVRHLRLGD